MSDADRMDLLRISRLRAMARQWDECARNAPEGGLLRRDPAADYRRWAAECRRLANEIEAT